MRSPVWIRTKNKSSRVIRVTNYTTGECDSIVSDCQRGVKSQASLFADYVILIISEQADFINQNFGCT